MSFDGMYPDDVQAGFVSQPQRSLYAASMRGDAWYPDTDAFWGGPKWDQNFIGTPHSGIDDLPDSLHSFQGLVWQMGLSHRVDASVELPDSYEQYANQSAQPGTVRTSSFGYDDLPDSIYGLRNELPLDRVVDAEPERFSHAEIFPFQSNGLTVRSPVKIIHHVMTSVGMTYPDEPAFFTSTDLRNESMSTSFDKITQIEPLPSYDICDNCIDDYPDMVSVKVDTKKQVASNPLFLEEIRQPLFDFIKPYGPLPIGDYQKIYPYQTAAFYGRAVGLIQTSKAINRAKKPPSLFTPLLVLHVF